MPKPNAQRLNRHERAVAVTRRAFEMLGVPETRDGLYHAKQRAFWRFAYGSTEVDLLEVIEYASRCWDAGDHQAHWKNVEFLWSKEFASLLAAARAEDAAPTRMPSAAFDDVPRESDADFMKRAGIAVDSPHSP